MSTVKIFRIDLFKEKLKQIEDHASVKRSLLDWGMTEEAARLYVAGYTSAMAKVEEALAESFIPYEEISSDNVIE